MNKKVQFLNGMDFIKKYTSHEEYEVNKTPNVSLCIEDNETKHLRAYNQKIICFFSV